MVGRFADEIVRGSWITSIIVTFSVLAVGKEFVFDCAKLVLYNIHV